MMSRVKFDKHEKSENKTNYAPMVITPVTAIIKQMRRTDQKTLTELFGTGSDASTDSDFESNTKKKRKTPERTKSTTKQVASPKKRPKRTSTTLVPILKSPPSIKSSRAVTVGLGDLVMATAQSIDHPDHHNGKVSGSYIFVGIVKGTHHADWCSKNPDEAHATPISSDMVNVDWVTAEQGYTPIKTRNVKPSRLYKSNGNTPHTGPVSKKN